jgi:hypothetical protein
LYYIFYVNRLTSPGRLTKNTAMGAIDVTLVSDDSNGGQRLRQVLSTVGDLAVGCVLSFGPELPDALSHHGGELVVVYTQGSLETGLRLLDAVRDADLGPMRSGSSSLASPTNRASRPRHCAVAHADMCWVPSPRRNWGTLWRCSPGWSRSPRTPG